VKAFLVADNWVLSLNIRILSKRS